ncbi:MAG: cytochrome c [Sutterellaceae bacterium]|nr:cytochrome c [Burkholderiaceae bacterium]MDW8430859.1 cytochrome c [Sutterellaceae bacterium]
MIIKSVPAVALVVTVAASTAAAQETKPGPDLNRGQQIASQVCAACHGADGNSVIAANPKLAGQHAEYLYKQLVDYTVQPKAKTAARENAVMAGFAAALSEQDRRNVAAYYAAQTLKPGFAKNKETLELAQRIYRAGVPERAVPACAGCHGPNGAGIPIQYPRLAGQHAEYTEAQLKAFRDGTRRNNEAMQQIAARLSDREMKALADYLAGLR